MQNPLWFFDRREVVSKDYASVDASKYGDRCVLCSDKVRKHGLVFIYIPISAWVQPFFYYAVQDVFGDDVWSRATVVYKQAVDVGVHERKEALPATVIFTFAFRPTRRKS